MIVFLNFLSNYGNNENCEWIFRGLIGYFLILIFLIFNFEFGLSCNLVDYLEIRDVNLIGILFVWLRF